MFNGLKVYFDQMNACKRPTRLVLTAMTPKCDVHDVSLVVLTKQVAKIHNMIFLLHCELQVKVLEKDLNRERQEYEDLTAKYDLLEEDYVVVKAKLVMEKENIEMAHNKLKQEHETMSSELHTARDNFTARQDVWINDKLDKEVSFMPSTIKNNMFLVCP